MDFEDLKRRIKKYCEDKIIELSTMKKFVDIDVLPFMSNDIQNIISDFEKKKNN